MAEKFDPRNVDRLENPERLLELPPAEVVRLLRLSGAETVVDYGAGSGVYTVPVAEAVPQGRVIAVEAYPELLARLAGKLSADLRPRVTLVQTETNSVPLGDGAADRVFMINVLHHIHDEAEALDEVVRLLARGGLLVTIDFGQMDRPVGPPSNHVLSSEKARAVIAGMGLRELELHEPGTLLRYHLAIVAQRP